MTISNGVAIAALYIITVYCAPGILTGTADPCEALAVARVDHNAPVNDPSRAFAFGLVRLVGGALVAEQMNRDYPSVPPQIACVAGFWTTTHPQR